MILLATVQHSVASSTPTRVMLMLLLPCHYSRRTHAPSQSRFVDARPFSKSLGSNVAVPSTFPDHQQRLTHSKLDLKESILDPTLDLEAGRELSPTTAINQDLHEAIDLLTWALQKDQSKSTLSTTVAHYFKDWISSSWKKKKKTRTKKEKKTRTTTSLISWVTLPTSTPKTCAGLQDFRREDSGRGRRKRR